MRTLRIYLNGLHKVERTSQLRLNGRQNPFSTSAFHEKSSGWKHHAPALVRKVTSSNDAHPNGYIHILKYTQLCVYIYIYIYASGYVLICAYFFTELICTWSSVVNFLILKTFKCDNWTYKNWNIKTITEIKTDVKSLLCNCIFPRILWPIMIYDITMTTLIAMEK